MTYNLQATKSKKIDLSDNDLNLKLKNLAAYELKLTEVILLHIAEVDSRKLYLRLAYSSMFDYLTKEIGYSEGAAQRRIDAARFIQVVPELAQKIQNGSIKLSQVSYVQKLCRQLKKETGVAVSAEIRKDVLAKIENLNSADTQSAVAEVLQSQIKVGEVISVLKQPSYELTIDSNKTYQADKSVRLELTISKDEMEWISKAQELLSNQSGGSLKDTVVLLAKKMVLSKLEDKTKTQKATATVAVNSKHKTLSLKIKRQILNRDQCCQFVNHTTGKVCGSKYFLEVDHVKPRFAEGTHAENNLRVLCRAHNQFRYKFGM